MIGRDRGRTHFVRKGFSRGFQGATMQRDFHSPYDIRGVFDVAFDDVPLFFYIYICIVHLIASRLVFAWLVLQNSIYTYGDIENACVCVCG